MYKAFKLLCLKHYHCHDREYSLFITKFGWEALTLMVHIPRWCISRLIRVRITEDFGLARLESTSISSSIMYPTLRTSSFSIDSVNRRSSRMQSPMLTTGSSVMSSWDRFWKAYLIWCGRLDSEAQCYSQVLHSNERVPDIWKSNHAAPDR